MAEAAVADTTTAETKTDTTTVASTTDNAATATTTTAATTDTSKATATAVADKTEVTDTGKAKGYWPDDWLTRISKGDEKRAKDFGKFQSPEALAEAYVNLRRRMDSGEVRPTLPKDPKPEELKAWRKDNGIPEKPEGYDLKGLEIPKEDKAIVDAFLTAAHSKHFTPEQARTAIQSYYAIEKKNVEARAARDEEQRTEALDALNQEYGGQFRRNVNLVEGVLSKFPESVRDALKSARLPDGTLLFNNPDAVRGFVALALEVNPAGIVVRGGDGDIAKTMIERFNEITKVMHEDRKKYDKDDAMQKEYVSLINAMQKHGLMDNNGVLKKAA